MFHLVLLLFFCWLAHLVVYVILTLALSFRKNVVAMLLSVRLHMFEPGRSSLKLR